MRVLAAAALLLAGPAFGQYGGPPKAGGGLPPFLQAMQRHDITVRVQRTAPDGTVSAAAAGLPVGVRILAGGASVKDYTARTSAEGLATLQGVPSNPQVQSSIRYQAYVVADGVKFPFDLDSVPDDQSEIVVAVPEVTTELGDIHLTHTFIEMFPDEEALVVRHEMRLTYGGRRAVNLSALPGGGLIISTPPGAKHPSLHDEHDPMVEVRGTDLVFKGALLPGGEPAKFTTVYSIPYDDPTFEWSQVAPVPMSVGVVVATKDRQKGHRAAFPLTLESRGFGSIEESTIDGGRRFQILRGGDAILPAGTPLRFAVLDLPVPSKAKAIGLLIGLIAVFGLVFFGFRKRAAGPRFSRTHLVAERDRLVRALARMRKARERGRMTEARFVREREAITARLVSLYRALDRLEAR